jgi:multiple sugar transport system permease protein
MSAGERSGARHAEDRPRQLSPDGRRSRIVLALIVMPLIAQLGLVVWRLGQDGRQAYGDRLVVRADSAVDALRMARSLSSEPATPVPSTADSVAPARGAAVPASANLTTPDTLPAAGKPVGSAMPQGMPDSLTLAVMLDRLRSQGLEPVWFPMAGGMASPLPAGIAARLASLDRSFWIEDGGGISAVSPLEDVDGWDYVGVLGLGSDADPTRFPFAPSLAALAVLALVAMVTRATSRPPDRNRPGGAAWVAMGRRASIFLPPLIFAIWIGMMPTPGQPVHAGQHGLWASAGFAGWAILAAIGLSLVRIADRPLDSHQAVRAWAFLAPSFLHLLVFSVGPILFAFWLSFHEWNLLEPARPFVGLDNYRELAGDADFWRAIRNTTVYVLFVPAGMAVALGLALFVNRRIPGVRIMRTILFLPYITSFVAISLVWRWMFQPDVGLFNNLLGRVGIPPQPWLSSPSSALPSLMLMSVWMYAGYMMVIFLAGLQNIPETLYESAKIDGAGPWRRFLHITLPMLRPTLLFILVTMVIFMFQVFTAVYVMTEGGPLHATDVVVYHVYRAAWEYLRMGYASAMAWVLFAIVFVITLIQFRWLGDRTGQAAP